MRQQLVKCSLGCGHFVDSLDKFTPRRVVGWSTTGQSGGSDVFLREYRDEWACRGCIDKLKAGVPLGQESFV